MKKLIAAFLCVLALVMLAAVYAFAGSAGGYAPAISRINVPVTVPKKASATCKTLAAGARATQTFDVSGTTMVTWKAFASDYSSTAVTLKRSFDSNTAYMPNSGESNLAIEPNVTNITFQAFSSASPASSRICLDAN